jgi:hypothetical protein
MRKGAGYASSTGGERIEDYTLRGLDQLLEILPTLTSEQAVKKTALLWDSLCDVEDRRGARAFMGAYSWYYFQRRSCSFPAGFVRQLNKVAWVPDDKGVLQQAEFVVFDRTGWKANPFLLSRIRFKPPLLETLAREAGIEPGMLDLLKKLGLTSEAELKTRLGITDEPQPPEAKPVPGNVDDALMNILGTAPQPTPPVPDPSGPEPAGTGGSGTSSGAGSGAHGALALIRVVPPEGMQKPVAPGAVGIRLPGVGARALSCRILRRIRPTRSLTPMGWISSRGWHWRKRPSR